MPSDDVLRPLADQQPLSFAYVIPSHGFKLDEGRRYDPENKREVKDKKITDNPMHRATLFGKKIYCFAGDISRQAVRRGYLNEALSLITELGNDASIIRLQ